MYKSPTNGGVNPGIGISFKKLRKFLCLGFFFSVLRGLPRMFLYSVYKVLMPKGSCSYCIGVADKNKGTLRAVFPNLFLMPPTKKIPLLRHIRGLSLLEKTRNKAKIKFSFVGEAQSECEDFWYTL